MNHSALVLRSASLDDAQLLLDWRNDAATRHASHTTDAVDIDTHVAWLSRSLDDPARHLYIAEQDGRAVGTVRADLRDGVHELSWTVAPEARGQGIAKRMVAELTRRLDEPIRAEIKPGHLASIRVAEHVGMTLDREVDGVLHYRRDRGKSGRHPPKSAPT